MYSPPPPLPSGKLGERGQSVSNPSPIFPEARGGLYTGYQKVLRFESYWEYSDFFFQAACATDWKTKHLSRYDPCVTRFFHFIYIYISCIIMAQRSPENRPTVACSQTLYFLFRDRRARVLTQKPPGIYWPLAKRGWCGGKDCLVPRSHDCARPMRFGSRGPSEPFVSESWSKCIDRGTRQWKRALDFLLISRAPPLFSRSRSLASFACSSIVEKKRKEHICTG